MPRTKLIIKTIGLVINIIGLVSVIILNSSFAVSSLLIAILILIFGLLLIILGLALYLAPSFFIAKRKELILLTVTTIISLAILELGVRIILPQPQTAWYGYPTGLFIPDDTKGFSYQPNFQGYFPNPPYDKIEIKINSHGLRDNEHDYTKSAGVKRILGLGDSVTFGAGVDFEDTYLYQLEKKFTADSQNVEIIKTGVNSYEFDQEYTYYFETGYKYSPDIVIIGVTLNDLREITPEEIQLEKTQLEISTPKIETLTPAEQIKKYCHSCFALYLLTKSQTEAQIQKEHNQKYFELKLNKDWNDNWERYKQKIIDFNYALENDNIKLVLVIFPDTQQFENSYNLSKIPQKKIQELEGQIEIIDILPILDRPDWQKYYLPGDSIHPNSDGHKLIADFLYNKISEIIK
ncbi:MAG TPA: SGNH/GDSL hydrolase family protein [Patescibacteria group bacterium]|nr:SGNH/GDSL hydrolase family protein [Patescibacteria group bacterium]